MKVFKVHPTVKLVSFTADICLTARFYVAEYLLEI
jgi:hypothetical protein